MDIKSMTKLMQLTMLKNMTTDSGTDGLTGSTGNSDMFKLMLEAMIDQASGTSTSSNADASELIQLMALQNSMLGSESVLQDDSTADDSGSLQSMGLDGLTGISASGGAASSAEIEQAIQAASKKYGVDEAFIRAMIKQESGFKSNAVSNAGAMGLMQLMPKTAESLGVNNPFDVLENIDGGTKYVKQLMDSFNGSKELALSAYNGGISRMNKRGVDTVDEINNMPKETQNYVAKVMKAYESYKK